LDEVESGALPSKAADEGASKAKDPTAAASLAIRVSRSLAIAFPAAAAMSDLIAELSGALALPACEGAPGPAGLSLLQAIARIRTPAKVMKLYERLGIWTPLLPG